MKLFYFLLLSLSFSTLFSQDTDVMKELYAELDSIQRDTVSSFTITYTNAEFKGGFQSFAEYIRKNLNYPEIAVKEKAEGRVYVSFDVSVNGTIIKGSVKVDKSDNVLLDEEAIRLIENSPPWVPGTKSLDGGTPTPIKSHEICPILFRLSWVKSTK